MSNSPQNVLGTMVNFSFPFDAEIHLKNRRKHVKAFDLNNNFNSDIFKNLKKEDVLSVLKSYVDALTERLNEEPLTKHPRQLLQLYTNEMRDRELKIIGKKRELAEQAERQRKHAEDIFEADKMVTKQFKREKLFDIKEAKLQAKMEECSNIYKLRDNAKKNKITMKKNLRLQESWNTP
eukprot:g3025.t1